MSKIAQLILFLSLLASVACRSFDKERAARDFLSQNPTFQVVSVSIGEGDSDTAYVHIRYTRPGSPQVEEDIWQYLRDDLKGWHVEHKQTTRTSESKTP
jgi:hypothetical protein